MVFLNAPESLQSGVFTDLKVELWNCSKSSTFQVFMNNVHWHEKKLNSILFYLYNTTLQQMSPRCKTNCKIFFRVFWLFSILPYGSTKLQTFSWHVFWHINIRKSTCMDVIQKWMWGKIKSLKLLMFFYMTIKYYHWWTIIIIIPWKAIEDENSELKSLDS